MEFARDRAILLAGDINFDLFVKSKQEGASQVPFPIASGYQGPNPNRDWSYLAHTGKGYKIDHVIHTPGVVVTEVEYLTRIGDRFLAGEKSKSPTSDHAALRFVVGTTLPPLKVSRKFISLASWQRTACPYPSLKVCPGI